MVNAVSAPATAPTSTPTVLVVGGTSGINLGVAQGFARAAQRLKGVDQKRNRDENAFH